MGGKVGSLLTVIEAADPDIIGNRIPQLIQCLDQIHGNKVIGADKGIRHRFEPTYGFVQGYRIVLLSRWHRTGVQAFCQTKVLHCILISHITLKEGLTVVFIPRKADAFFAALDHVGHRILDLNAVFHIKAVGFKGRTHIHHRGVYKQQRNIQIAQHLCIVIVEYFNADDAGWASIMYTASLSNASKDLKEAAMIDGANLIQQIMTVEWPAIKDMVVIQFILQAGNIMSIGFEKAYALQTDLNLNTAEIIATYVYKKGLLDGDYSFSTAVGLFNTVVNVILLIAVNKIVAKMNDGKGL